MDLGWIYKKDNAPCDYYASIEEFMDTITLIPSLWTENGENFIG